MAVVRDLLNRKGTNIVSVAPTATVLEAARLMNDRSVGGVLVVDDSGSLLGIFTERDILRRVVAAGLQPGERFVALGAHLLHQGEPVRTLAGTAR